MTDDKPERIQKVLANAGVASRREIERMIRAQRVVVNGRPATLGQPITFADNVEIDGTEVIFNAPGATRIIMYHKPVGEICTRSDPEGRTTIFESLPALASGRWVSVGRLDLNSSGLIILTTDGKLADALMHPSNRVVREYHVRVLGEVDEAAIRHLRKGVRLDDGMARFDSIELTAGSGSNKWYVCRLKEGRNREVRRLFEAVGCRVNRLMRTRYGPVRLPRDLLPGESRELESDLVRRLYSTAGFETT